MMCPACAVQRAQLQMKRTNAPGMDGFVPGASHRPALKLRRVMQAKPLYDLLDGINRAAAAPRPQPQSV